MEYAAVLCIFKIRVQKFSKKFSKRSLKSTCFLDCIMDIYTGKIQLIWSYILGYENDKNPFKERKMQIRGWKKYVIIDIQENNELLGTANSLNQKGIKKFDSLHIAWFPCSGVGTRKQEP